MRSRVPRNIFSDSSIASQRSSRGVRFQRPHLVQITHSRPFFGSNASRRPTGNVGRWEFAPGSVWQKRQEVYNGGWGTRDGGRGIEGRRIARCVPTETL